jgi:hypothetical protein
LSRYPEKSAIMSDREFSGEPFLIHQISYGTTMFGNFIVFTRPWELAQEVRAYAAQYPLHRTNLPLVSKFPCFDQNVFLAQQVHNLDGNGFMEIECEDFPSTVAVRN